MQPNDINTWHPKLGITLLLVLGVLFYLAPAMTKDHFTHLLLAEGYLPHEIENIWEMRPAHIDADTLDPKLVASVAKEMLPKLREYCEYKDSAWD